jgi:hypothetical protein
VSPGGRLLLELEEELDDDELEEEVLDEDELDDEFDELDEGMELELLEGISGKS